MNNSPEQAAAKLGVSVSTLRRLVDESRIGWTQKGVGQKRTHFLVSDEAIEDYQRANQRAAKHEINRQAYQAAVAGSSFSGLSPAPSRY